MQPLLLHQTNEFNKILNKGVAEKLKQRNAVMEKERNEKLRACLHGDGGPQVGEVTRLGGVSRLSI